MDAYRLAPCGVVRISDGVTITRGDTGWSDYQRQVSAGYVPEPMAPSVAALADRQQRAWSRIKERREEVKHSGVLVLGKWFHTDEQSRLQHLGLMAKGSGIPTGVMWKTMDGSFVEMTPALVAGVLDAVMVLDLASFSVAEAHKAAMLAASNPDAYDYSAGWPGGFQV